MKILIDIGHPAHVHYFRNFIKIMEDRGHEFLIIAKNRSVTFNLLDSYNIKFIKRRNYPKSLIGKLINESYEAVIIIPTIDEEKTTEFYKTLSSKETIVRCARTR